MLSVTEEKEYFWTVVVLVLFSVVLVMCGYNWGQASMEYTFKTLGCSLSVEKESP